MAEIARQIGTSKQNFHKRAKRERWAERRASVGQPSALGTLDGTPADRSANVATANPGRKQSPRDAMLVIDRYLAEFQARLDDGRLRFDSVTDFATVVKLRQVVAAEMIAVEQSRSDLPDLLELQRRHREHRLRVQTIAETPGLAGVVGNDIESPGLT